MDKNEYRQLRLTDDGQFLFQPDPTNPLPGAPVARIRKGASILSPEIETPYPEAADKIAAWLALHIRTVLEPLAALAEAPAAESAPPEPAPDEPAPAAESPAAETPAAETLGAAESPRAKTPPAPSAASAAAVDSIAASLRDALGIVPREDVAGLIAGLDDAGRQALRKKQIRLGPVMVYMPALNKPAAVRLRALLWALWNDRPLPAAAPPDGTTSFIVAGRAETDPAFYRAAGYPVCGPRAIRADMLDRLVGAIYDGAENGRFRARHEMAEWLGCPISELYAVIEALGHEKISDPAETPPPAAETAPETPTPAPPVETPAAADAPPAAAPEEQAQEQAPEEKQAEQPEQKQEQEQKKEPAPKPELATFRLRRARKHHVHDRRGGERPARPRGDSGKQGEGQPWQKHGDKKRDGKKREDRDGKKGRDRDRGRGRDQDRGRDRDRGEDRIVSAAPAKHVADSPFAILKNLKVRQGE